MHLFPLPLISSSSKKRRMSATCCAASIKFIKFTKTWTHSIEIRSLRIVFRDKNIAIWVSSLMRKEKWRRTLSFCVKARGMFFWGREARNMEIESERAEHLAWHLSISYYVRSTSYLGACLSFSPYSLTLRTHTAESKEREIGKEKYYIKFEGWLRQGMCVHVRE